MQRILLATDFSTRSDIALQRAKVLAHQLSSGLLLVHVVDDDQPETLIEAERRAAAVLLDDLAGSCRDPDGIKCEARVALGASFQGILNVAEGAGAPFIVLGPHRRQALLDTFVGTTAERTVRHSRRPVLIAKVAPSGRYRNVLFATDLSENSIVIARETRALGLLNGANIVVMHAFAHPVTSPVLQSSMTSQELACCLSGEEQRIRNELQNIQRIVDIKAELRAVLLSEKSAGMAIKECSHDLQSDLVVVGTQGRKGLDRWFLGSVAEEVLGSVAVDVLAFPVPQSNPECS